MMRGCSLFSVRGIRLDKEVFRQIHSSREGDSLISSGHALISIISGAASRKTPALMSEPPPSPAFSHQRTSSK